MILQASNGHGHFIGQPPLLAPRQFPRPPHTPHAIACCVVFLFEPSMLRTRDSKGRRRAHEAPVENAVGENSTRAKQKQTLFSPCIRLRSQAAPRCSPGPKGLFARPGSARTGGS